METLVVFFICPMNTLLCKLHESCNVWTHRMCTLVCVLQSRQSPTLQCKHHGIISDSFTALPPSANEPTWKNHFTIYTTNNSYALAFGCFDPDIRSENPCNSKYVYTSRAKVFKRYFSKQHEAVRQPCRMVRREPESRSLTSIVMTSFFSLAHSASSS